MKLQEITVGSTEVVQALLVNYEEALSKAGSTFMRLTLKDDTAVIKCIMFNSTLADFKGIAQGSVVEVTLSCEIYQNTKNYKCMALSPSTETDISSFIKKPPISIDTMFDEMKAIVVANAKKYKKPNTDEEYETLSEATVRILDTYEVYYKKSSAAQKMHHAFYGGLIYHSYRMLKSAQMILNSNIYNVDKELVLCGIVLHDIGKIQEYNTSADGSAYISYRGYLKPHSVSGAELVKYYMKNVHPLKVDMLQHIIYSHHAEVEWGAIRTPFIPEALMVSMLDNMDAKLEMFEEQYEAMPSNTFSDKHYGLNVNVFKPDYENCDYETLVSMEKK